MRWKMLRSIYKEGGSLGAVTMQLLDGVKVKEVMLPYDEAQYVEVKAIGVQQGHKDDKKESWCRERERESEMKW